MKGKRLKEEKNNKIIIIALVLILIVTTILIIVIKYYQDNNKKNTIKEIESYSNIENKIENNKEENSKVSEEFIKEKEFYGMRIKDIELKRDDGITFFSANVENITNKKLEKQQIEVVFVDENDAQLAIFTVELNEIGVNETINLPISSSMNLLNAYNFKIER